MDNLFADIAKAPAVQSLARRLEDGGVFTCAGVCQAAQPFFAVLLQNIFSDQPLILITPDLKTQENFHQDIETWLDMSRVSEKTASANADFSSRLSTLDLRPLFYPAWEILPHEGKLPHADTISDRLQTLVSLSNNSALRTPYWS